MNGGMKIPVYLCTCLTFPCIAYHIHSKMFRRPGQVRADGADTKQSDRLAAQHAWLRSPPFPDLLCLDALQHFLLQEEQIAEHIFRHQLAENPPGIGEYILLTLGGIQQRLDTC